MLATTIIWIDHAAMKRLESNTEDALMTHMSLMHVQSVAKGYRSCNLPADEMTLLQHSYLGRELLLASQLFGTFPEEKGGILEC